VKHGKSGDVSQTPAIGRRPLVAGNYTLAKLFKRDVAARIFYPPTSTGQSLSRLDLLPQNALDPEYLHQIDSFREEILSNTVSRHQLRVDVADEGADGTRGAGLVARLTTLIEAARDGRLPELVWSTEWEAKLVASATATALNARDAGARVALRASPPLAPDAFLQTLRRARLDAERLFKTHLFDLERMWRLPLEHARVEMIRREAEDVIRHDTVVDQGLSVAADDAISAALTVINAVRRPVFPETLARELKLAIADADSGLETTTKPYERCYASRGRARRAQRQYRRARDAAVADATRDNAEQTSETLNAATAAATRAYDLEMTASTLAAGAERADDTDVDFVETPSPPSLSEDAPGLPLRASSLAALHAAAAFAGARAFDDALEAASASWTMSSRDGIRRRVDVLRVLETRGGDWKRRNGAIAADAARVARERVVAFATAETAALALPELRDALRNGTDSMTHRAFGTFDTVIVGFGDIPECVVERETLALGLRELSSGVDKRNAQAWVSALALVGDAATATLRLEKSCPDAVRDARGAATTHFVSAWMHVGTACVRDASPEALTARAVAAWLNAFRDAGTERDADEKVEGGNFFTKTTRKQRKTLDITVALRKAHAMPPDALRDVAKSFAETDAFVASRRDAARASRRAVLSAAAALVAAAAAVFADVAVRSSRRHVSLCRVSLRRPRGSRSRSNTPPLVSDPQSQNSVSRELTPNPLAFAAAQPLPGDHGEEEEEREEGDTEDDDDDGDTSDDSDTTDDDADTTEDDSETENDGSGLADTGDIDLNADDHEEYAIENNPLFGESERADDEYVHVPGGHSDGDDTFDAADETFRRGSTQRQSLTSETRDERETLRDFLTKPLAPLAITVGDLRRALLAVRGNNPGAFNWVIRFHAHKDVKRFCTAADTRGRGDSAHFLAGFHENVLHFVRERVSEFDDETWSETPYVQGVLKKYKQAVSVTVIEPSTRNPPGSGFRGTK
jgi:hypothetical protein